jgi:hypothetical protein
MDDEQDDPMVDDGASDIPGDPEKKRAQMETGHEEALDALTPEPPAEVRDVAEEHDSVLKELSPKLDTPPRAPAKEPPISDLGGELGQAPQPEKRGRPYTPPKERTRATRDERRAEHTAWMNDRLGGREPPTPDVEEESGDDEGNGTLAEALKSYTEANHALHKAEVDALIDARNDLIELRQALERSRL